MCQKREWNNWMFDVRWILDLGFAMFKPHWWPVRLLACMLACLPLPACMSACLPAMMGGIELDWTGCTRLKWGGMVWIGLEWDEIE